MAHPWARFAVALLLFGVAGCSSPTAPERGDGTSTPGVTPSPAVTAAIVELTNTERTRSDLATLATNARLMQAAQLQADQLVRLGRLEHVVADGTYPRPEDRLAAAGYEWRAWGENLASGQRSAAQAVQGWMDSPGHRANILNATFTEIGAGYATDGSGRPYYVQVFGRPR